jgi:hypothetical protein
LLFVSAFTLDCVMSESVFLAGGFGDSGSGMAWLHENMPRQKLANILCAKGQVDRDLRHQTWSEAVE